MMILKVLTISPVLFKIFEHYLMNGQTFFTSGVVGAHTESLQLRDDNNSSSSEDEDSQASLPAATTSGASESATQLLTTAAKCAWPV